MLADAGAVALVCTRQAAAGLPAGLGGLPWVGLDDPGAGQAVVRRRRRCGWGRVVRRM